MSRLEVWGITTAFAGIGLHRIEQLLEDVDVD